MRDSGDTATARWYITVVTTCTWSDAEAQLELAIRSRPQAIHGALQGCTGSAVASLGGPTLSSPDTTVIAPSCESAKTPANCASSPCVAATAA